MNPNYADFIRLNSTCHQFCSFLVDAQADISLIISCLTFDTILNKNEVIDITGVTNETVLFLGTICTNLIFLNQLISQNFHVGILGKDFLKDNLCKIGYETLTLTMNTRLNSFNIPILRGRDNFTCIVPPRSEVFKTFRLHHILVLQPMFVDNQEIIKGVFVAPGIIDTTNPVLRLN